MKQLLIYIWNKIPPSGKMALHSAAVVAEGALVGFLVQWAANPQPLCFKRSCLASFFGAMAGAVIAALRNWFRQSAGQTFAEYKAK